MASDNERKNAMRDMKRDILRAVRESQKAKQETMDEYVASRVAAKSLQARLTQAEETARELRAKARDAGNTVAELKLADDLIESRWEDEPSSDGTAEPTPSADGDTQNPLAEPSATPAGYEPRPWEEGES